MEDKTVVKNDIPDCNADLKSNKTHRKATKEKLCEVINYNKLTKTLDIRFDKYGIRLYDIEDCNTATILIKYKGEIGKPNFKIEM